MFVEVENLWWIGDIKEAVEEKRIYISQEYAIEKCAG